jgi:hypothetical protein
VRPARKADNFTAICVPIVYKMWEPRCLTTLWGSMACYRDSFPLVCVINILEKSRYDSEPGYLSLYSDWLWAGRPRSLSSSPGRIKNFLFSTSCIPALGSTQHLIQWVQGAPSPGAKWPGSEADNSPPTSVEVKKICIYTSTPHTPSWHSA